MRGTTAVFGLICGMGLGAYSVAQAEAAKTPMAAVEQGLLPAVIAVGQGAGSTQALSLKSEMDALHVPGVVIAVIHHGKVEWIKGYGVTRAGGQPVTADTLFQAGSVSKPVAAMAALKLVQDGKLSLDRPVNAGLKTWTLPENDFTRTTPVTLRHLLSHTAGTTVHGFQGYAAGEAVPSLTQVLDGAKPANSDPIRVDQPVGQTYRYSGGGYTVMQSLLIDTTGKSFPEVVRNEVLQPLGMRRSTYEQPLPAARMAEIAWPHDEAGKLIAGGPHTYPEMAAAGLWTTAPDLAAYVIEIQDALKGQGRVLSQDTAKTMVTPVKGDWGLGLEIGGATKDIYVYHDGSNVGYKATLVGYPTRGDGAVILTNGDQGYQLGQEIVRAIATTYGWPDFQPIQRRQVALDMAQQTRFTGTFTIKDLGSFEIRQDGNHLVAEIRAGQVYALLPSSDHGFFMTAQDIVITFASADNADDGAIDAGTFHAEFHRVAAPAK